ncbi:MAG: EexN family lipoprotein [Snodgrassella alvi]|nr:EexN family lipoprotein [Snodgrassella alvi]
MRKFALLTVIIMSMAACTHESSDSSDSGDSGVNKTVSYYKQHQNILEEDLEKCKNISLSNQPDWCAAAQQASRDKDAQKVLDSAKHRAF